MSRFTYFPPAPTALPIYLEWNDADPFLCADPRGLMAAVAALPARKAPGERGETIEAITIGPRTITLPVTVAANNRAALFPLRAKLAQAFAMNPTRIAEKPKMGTLVLERDGLEPLEVSCLPASGPIYTGKDYPRFKKDEKYAYLEFFDIDLYCPTPEWRAQDTETIELVSSSGGLQFAVQFPIQSGAYSLTKEIINPSDIECPVMLRMYGDATTVRLRNLTYDEMVEVTGNVPSGSYIEADTEHGYRYVDSVVESTGVRTDALSRLKLDTSTWWFLRPGVNIVRFEADTNTSGRGLVAYRRRYSAV